jgi:hypothetical protein
MKMPGQDQRSKPFELKVAEHEAMKTNLLIRTTLALLPVALLILVSCSSTSEPPPPVGTAWFYPNKGAAGGVRVQTVKMSGAVTAIDKIKRTATILAPDGITFMVTVKPEAVNFGQINVRDQVTVTVVERIAESLIKEGDASVAGPPSTGGRLAPEISHIRGKIKAVDFPNRTVTLEFEDGNTKTVETHGDYHYQAGEKFEMRVTEMIAIWIEKKE